MIDLMKRKVFMKNLLILTKLWYNFRKMTVIRNVRENYVRMDLIIFCKGSYIDYVTDVKKGEG